MKTKRDLFDVLMARPDEIQAFGVKRLGLFGSFVRGDQNGESDVDLLVEFEAGQKTFDNFMQLSFWLEDVLARPVDLVTIDSLSPYLRPRIVGEAEYVPFTA